MEKVKITNERTHCFAPAINIVMSADIGGNVSLEKLKSAILAAVHHHTLLTSKIVQDEAGNCFYVPTHEQTAKITVCKNADAGYLQEIINEQERIPFDLAHGELLRFFLSQEKECTKLVMIAHHLAGDGTAMLYLLQDIMNYLSGSVEEKEPFPIVLMNDENIPKDAKLNFFIRMMTKAVNRQWNKSKHIFNHSEYINMCQKYWGSRKSKVITDKIQAQQLQKLLDTSKQHGVSVNSTITTAFLIAAQGESDVGIAVSARPDGYEGMGNYATGISIQYTYDKNKQFWENTATVHTLIYKKLKNKSKKFFLHNFMNALEPTLIDAAYFRGFADFENATAGKVCDMFGYSGNPKGISITNLTKAPIPEIYGEFQMSNLIFVPPLVPNAKRIIGIVTLGDTMTISMQFLDGKTTDREEKIFSEAMKELKA